MWNVKTKVIPLLLLLLLLLLKHLVGQVSGGAEVFVSACGP